jgi:1-aminocyclopropane-1-carboxylate deaminase
MNFPPSQLDPLDLSSYGIKNEIYIKRDDLIHPIVSGNKWRKLKQNISFFKSSDFAGIISLGGAYSSHILSLSFLCFKQNIPCVLIIRGEEPKEKNEILLQCLKFRASLHFCSRREYSDSEWVSNFIKNSYPFFFHIPEGGANKYGINGCKDIIKELNIDFDEIYCEVGSGATLAGISSALRTDQIVKGIVVLKGASEIKKDIVNNYSTETGGQLLNNFILMHDYHFGGYAKFNQTLVNFMRDFRIKTGIKTDPIYSGKLFFGLVDHLRNNPSLSNKKIIALHSGGLSGIPGYEKRYGIKIFN